MIEIIGWAGVVAYVVAYGLLSLGKMKPDRVNYHALNAFGGICLVVLSYHKADTPNLIVNVIWVVIASLSILRILKIKR